MILLHASRLITSKIIAPLNIETNEIIQFIHLLGRSQSNERKPNEVKSIYINIMSFSPHSFTHFAVNNDSNTRNHRRYCLIYDIIEKYLTDQINFCFTLSLFQSLSLFSLLSVLFVCQTINLDSN